MAVYGVGLCCVIEWGENVGGSSQSGRIVTTRHSCDGWCLSARELETIHGGVMEWGFVVLWSGSCNVMICWLGNAGSDSSVVCFMRMSDYCIQEGLAHTL